MSNKKSIAGVARRAKSEDKAFRKSLPKTAVTDSFQNFAARLGYGQNNTLSSSYYLFDYLTRNRTQLEAAYRTAWLVGQAVDAPAEDMTSAGIDFDGGLLPDQISQLQSAMMELSVWQRLCDTVKWSRLFGGAIAVMLIDGQDVSKPLNIDTVGEGQFKGLLVLDRWLVQPTLSDLITEMGPDLGLPKYYSVVADAQALASMKIHHSRVLRIDGIDLPYYQRLAENGWGESVIERIHDRLVAFDSATMGMAQLAYKAHLRTLKIEGLRELIASNAQAYNNLAKQLEFMRTFQSNEGITMLDNTDEFDTHTYTFAGLSDVIIQLGQQLSGALQIPLVRLFGQSPAGLNSTGESDLRTYYDHIRKTQETRLRKPLSRLMKVLWRSELGGSPPKDFNFHFKPLWQLKEEEKATIAATTEGAISDAMDKGIITQKQALQELKQQSAVTGVFTNITDEDINSAEDEVPSGEDLLESGAPNGDEPEETAPEKPV